MKSSIVVLEILISPWTKSFITVFPLILLLNLVTGLTFFGISKPLGSLHFLL